MAKLYATERAQRVIDTAVQLHGGDGVRSGHSVERLYREIRALAHLRRRLRRAEGRHRARSPAVRRRAMSMSDAHRLGPIAHVDTFRARQSAAAATQWPELLLDRRVSSIPSTSTSPSS